MMKINPDHKGGYFGSGKLTVGGEGRLTSHIQLKSHSFLTKISPVGTTQTPPAGSRALAFCEHDRFGMVSSHDPFGMAVNVTSNVWG